MGRLDWENARRPHKALKTGPVTPIVSEAENFVACYGGENKFILGLKGRSLSPLQARTALQIRSEEAMDWARAEAARRRGS